MSAGGRLSNSDPCRLYEDAATMDGTGGVSVLTAWQLGETNDYPQTAYLRFRNTGDEDVTIGDQANPTTLYADGVPVGVLFEGREVTLEPSDDMWTKVPDYAAALGLTWSIGAALASAGTVSVTVDAFYIRTTNSLLGREDALSQNDLDNVGAAVWTDNAISGLVTAVNNGLTNAHGAGSWAAGAAAPSAATVADAVWDEALSGHMAAGSAGLALFLAKGLAQCNYVLDNTEFNASGMMTAGRIRVFATPQAAAAATEGGSDEGEVATFAVAASGTTSGRLQLYKVYQE